MIKYVSLLILELFDNFHKKKIFNFLLKKQYKKLNIVFDIGAHKGESIVSFNRYFEIDHIYSFEASPLTFRILKDRLPKLKSSLKKTKLNIENLAVGSKSGKKYLKQIKESSSSTIKDLNTNSKYFKKKKKFLGLNNQNFFKKIIVNQVTIDNYMKIKKIRKIDFLKIDTEGYEYEIVKGALKNLKNIKLILFEHHYDDMIKKGYKFSDINSFLKKNNFEQIFKKKMPFRKTFEYIYINKAY